MILTFIQSNASEFLANLEECFLGTDSDYKSCTYISMDIVRTIIRL